MPAGGTPATVALDRAGVAYALHPYPHDPKSSHFGDEAAAALGVDPDRIFKTLVADAGGELVVAVVPVAVQLDLKALAASAGTKRAVLADPAVAARTTGYVVGGISPLGQRTRLRTFLDASASSSRRSSSPPASAASRSSSRQRTSSGSWGGASRARAPGALTRSAPDAGTHVSAPRRRVRATSPAAPG